MGASLFPEPYQPERDPAQLKQGAMLISYLQSQVPGQWTANRLEQSNHYTGMAYIAIDRRRSEMSSVVACVERRKRGDRTTFGTNNSVSMVKALSPHGGQGNDDDYTPVYDHPISRMIQYPNGSNGPDTFGSLLAHMDLQRGLTGSSLVWFVPSKQDESKPCQMYPLHTALTTPANQGGTRLYPEGAWQVQPYYATGTMWAYGGLAQRLSYNTILPAREVGALRNEHPLTRSDGYAAFQAAGVWMDILEQIDIARHSHMLQGQQTGTMVYIPGASDDTLKAAKADYMNRFAGARNARSINFLSAPEGTAGQFKVEQASESARELDFNTSHMAVSKLICALFRVPPGICGLDDSDNYAKHYALRQQFHDDLECDVRAYSQFFTKWLCRPWEKRPGDLRIKLQLPKIVNKERDEPSVADLISAKAILVNELRARSDMPPIRGGDLPVGIFDAWVMNQVVPPPAPAPMPGPDGTPLPEGTVGDDLPPDTTQDGAPANDQGDDTQGAVTAAALSSLGVPADDQGDETVQKAQRQAARAPGTGAPPFPGAVFDRSRHRWVRGHRPDDDDAPVPQYVSRINPQNSYANEDDRDSEDRYFSKKNRQHQKKVDRANTAVEAIRAKIAETETRYKEQTEQIKRGEHPRVQQLRQELAAATKRSNRTQGVKQPAQAQSVAPPANPQANHDTLAQRLLGGRPNVVLRIAGAAAGQMQHHRITDGASLKRYLDAGGVLPKATYGEAAKQVPVATPQAQQVVATAKQWAAAQAGKHADRVAQHFGISRERAHALLVHAIQATAEHAAKNGGAMPNVTIRDTRTGKTAKLSAKGKGPTAGAPPKPKNPSGKGSLPPRGGTVAKAWDANKHPRADDGRFVSAGDIRNASRDPKKAAALRETVTNPEQRKKLDAALKTARPLGGHKRSATATVAHGKFAGPEFHDEEGKEHVAILRGHLIAQLRSATDGTVSPEGARDGILEATKRVRRTASVHWREAKEKALHQFAHDFPNADAEAFSGVAGAFDDALKATRAAYRKMGAEAADMAEWRHGDVDAFANSKDIYRVAFEKAAQDAASEYTTQAQAVWGAIEAARDALGGKARLGRYFKALAQDDTGDEPIDDVRPEFRELLARLAG